MSQELALRGTIDAHGAFLALSKDLTQIFLELVIISADTQQRRACQNTQKTKRLSQVRRNTEVTMAPQLPAGCTTIQAAAHWGVGAGVCRPRGTEVPHASKLPAAIRAACLQGGISAQSGSTEQNQNSEPQLWHCLALAARG